MDAVETYRSVRVSQQQLKGEVMQMEEARKEALAAINDAERIMREELDSL